MKKNVLIIMLMSIQSLGDLIITNIAETTTSHNYTVQQTDKRFITKSVQNTMTCD